jgi:hypothetical protein
MIKIVKQKKPGVILEIGTHNGTRPTEWNTVHKHFMYYGFDLFEIGNDTTLLKEGLLYKGGSRKQRTSNHLSSIHVSHELFQGYSKDTLIEFRKIYGQCVDFAFIDGGHNAETIQVDWDIVKTLMNKGGIVIFDDYYSNCPGIDMDILGCNNVVNRISKVQLLPHKDTVIGRLGKTSIQLVQVNF